MGASGGLPYHPYVTNRPVSEPGRQPLTGSPSSCDPDYWGTWRPAPETIQKHNNNKKRYGSVKQNMAAKKGIPGVPCLGFVRKVVEGQQKVYRVVVEEEIPFDDLPDSVRAGFIRGQQRQVAELDLEPQLLS